MHGSIKRWMVGAGVAAALAAAGEAQAGVRSHLTTPQPKSTDRRPTVFGGFTPQGWPVVVRIARDRRALQQAEIVLDLKCTTGTRSQADFYRNVPVSRTGRFKASFGPARVDHADGTFDVYSGTARASVNAAWTRMTGTWQLHLTEHAATGDVTNDCESGAVRWTAAR
jgi:hypothetical protein